LVRKRAALASKLGGSGSMQFESAFDPHSVDYADTKSARKGTTCTIRTTDACDRTVRQCGL